MEAVGRKQGWGLLSILARMAETIPPLFHSHTCFPSLHPRSQPETNSACLPYDAPNHVAPSYSLGDSFLEPFYIEKHE